MMTNQKPVPVIKVPVRVRFVGGPWHNLMPLLDMTPPFYFTADGQHRYHLAQFETGWGTLYYQYVHFSLVSGRSVDSRVCGEWFPKFQINVKQLERRLAGKSPPKPRLRW